MLASVDCFFDRKYDDKNYTCLHFSCDVWQALTGESIKERLEGLLTAASEQRVRKSHRAAFTALRSPVDPCIVLMQRPRTPLHMGVYIRGKVLQLVKTGVEYLPVDLASRGFKTVKYYI